MEQAIWSFAEAHERQMKEVCERLDGLVDQLDRLNITLGALAMALVPEESMCQVRLDLARDTGDRSGVLDEYRDELLTNHDWWKS
jgi:hypothetical protein